MDDETQSEDKGALFAITGRPSSCLRSAFIQARHIKRH